MLPPQTCLVIRSVTLLIPFTLFPCMECNWRSRSKPIAELNRSAETFGHTLQTIDNQEWVHQKWSFVHFAKGIDMVHTSSKFCICPCTWEASHSQIQAWHIIIRTLAHRHILLKCCCMYIKYTLAFCCQVPMP